MSEDAAFKVGYADDGFSVMLTLYRSEPGVDSRHVRIMEEPHGDLATAVGYELFEALEHLLAVLDAGAGTRHDASWLAARLADFCDFVQANPLDPRRGHTIDLREAEAPGLPAPEDLQGA